MSTFRSLDVFCRAVRHAATCPPGAADHRLASASGLNTSTPSEGGFVVPIALAAPIMGKAFDTPVLSRVTRIPPDTAGRAYVPLLSESSRAAGSAWGGLTCNWVDEGANIAVSKPAFARLELRRKRLLGLVPIAGEMFDSAGSGLQTYLEQLFAAALRAAVEAAIVSGNGVAKPQSLLSAPATISVSRGTPGDIKAGDVRGMYSRLWAPSRPRAVWIAGESAGDALMELGSDYITFTADGPRLLGLPLLWSEHCSAIGTAGDLMLADLADYHLSMSDLRVEYSAHTGFDADEGTYRLLVNADGLLSWESPITPKNGSTTLSACVVLS